MITFKSWLDHYPSIHLTIHPFFTLLAYTLYILQFFNVFVCFQCACICILWHNNIAVLKNKWTLSLPLKMVMNAPKQKCKALGSMFTVVQPMSHPYHVCPGRGKGLTFDLPWGEDISSLALWVKRVLTGLTERVCRKDYRALPYLPPFTFAPALRCLYNI